ncbi:MAG: hypothetical protein AAFR61_06720 [Bacteroidota bacterium]
MSRITPCLLLFMLLLGCEQQQGDATASAVPEEELIAEEEETAQPVSDAFEEALQALGVLDYELKVLDTLAPSENFLLKRLTYLGQFEKFKEQADYQAALTAGMLRCTSARLKSTRELGSRLFPRVAIEYWRFADTLSAQAAFKAVEEIRDKYGWDQISKSPITYGRLGTQLYFITPGGFYMLEEVPPIEKILRAALTE